MFEYFGIVAVGLSWLICGFVLYYWKVTKHKSISEHIAGNRTAYFLGIIALSVIGPLFYVWILNYLVPKLHLGSMFVVLLTIVTIFQFITGLIPDDGFSWRSKAHRAIAYAEAFLFIPLSILMLISPHVSQAGKLAGVLTLGYFAVSSFLFWFIPKSKENYIFFQSFYIIVFQLQILVSAFV